MPPLQAKVALSTCWSAHRHKDGREMAQEIADLGFQYVELSHGIPFSLVPGILRAVEEGVLKVSSLHNFCPLPPGVLSAAPNLFEPTSSDYREQKQWVRYTRRTIEFADEVKAGYVVLHLGSARFLWGNPHKALLRYRHNKSFENLLEDKTYTRLRDKVLGKMRKKASSLRKTLSLLLEEVVPYAKEKAVRLGIENRERLAELPLEEDMPQFFNESDESSVVGYWHDSGHAQIKQQLGLIDHREHLEKNRQHLLGFHLHDANEKGRDHQPLGRGTVDFQMLRSFFRPEHPLVLEMSPRVGRDAVILSREYLHKLLEMA